MNRRSYGKEGDQDGGVSGSTVQRHSGRKITQSKRALVLDRKTMRKYIEPAEPYGVSRYDEPRDDLYYLQLAGKIQAGLKSPFGCSEPCRQDMWARRSGSEGDFMPFRYSMMAISKDPLTFISVILTHFLFEFLSQYAPSIFIQPFR